MVRHDVNVYAELKVNLMKPGISGWAEVASAGKLRAVNSLR